MTQQQEIELRATISRLSEDQLRDILCLIRALQTSDDYPESLFRAAYGDNYKELTKERATDQ